MSDGRIVIAIADTPPSLNVYTNAHWAKARRMKNDWQTLLRSELHRWRLPLHLERVEAHATFRYPVRRRRDIGNVQSTLEKFLGDALQPDFLSDDTHDRFTVTASIERAVGPKQTTIALTFWLPEELAA